MIHLIIFILLSLIALACGMAGVFFLFRAHCELMREDFNQDQ